MKIYSVKIKFSKPGHQNMYWQGLVLDGKNPKEAQEKALKGTRDQIQEGQRDSITSQVTECKKVRTDFLIIGKSIGK